MPRSSLRLRALIPVMLAILPLLGLILYSYFNQRQAAIHEVQRDELVAVRNLAAAKETAINNARNLLVTLARTPEVQHLEPQACHDLFAELLKEIPYFNTIGVTNADGKLVASAPAVPDPITYADRPWFQKVKQTRGLVLGETVLGRISGKFGNNLSWPIIDSAGRFQGAIVTQFDLDWLPGLLAKDDFPPTTALVLTDTSRKVLWRYPEPEKYLGKMLPAAFFKPMDVSDEGIASGGGLPGDPRLFAFARLAPPWNNLYMTIGLPMDWAVAPVNRSLWRNLIFLGLVALFSITAALSGIEVLVLRPVKRLQGVTERLAAGDMTVRSGLQGQQGELGFLAHSFDQMAATLQERDAALRESEERFRTLANAIPQLAWIANSDGYIFWYNQRWYDYTGTTPEDMKGWGWQSVHDPKVLPQVLEQWRTSLATAQPFDMVFPLRRSDGQFRQFLTRVLPVKDANGRIVKWFGTNTDITERKQAEEERQRLIEQLQTTGEELQVANEELQAQTEELATQGEELRQANEVLEQRVSERTAEVVDANERMKYLTSQILTAQEQERKRISMDLHDDLGQSLLVLRMQLNAMLRKSPADLPIRPGLEESAKYLVEIIDKVRSLSHALSPMSLGNLSLTQAVKTLLEEFQKYHDIGTEADLDEVGPFLSKEARVGVYRILQEFLSNVHKHAQATRVKVAIKALGDRVTVAMEDNGIGFNHGEARSAVQKPGGLGLLSMEGRVQMLGGRLSLESQLNRGTHLFFELPRGQETEDLVLPEAPV